MRGRSGAWCSDLPDEHFELLQYACVWHTHGLLNNDPTIGTCWDADRLDLARVGIQPDAHFMSTEFGRQMCLLNPAASAREAGRSYGKT